MKVEGIEVRAVSWPDELGPSADDSASEFFCEEGLGDVVAVRGGLHPASTRDFFVLLMTEKVAKLYLAAISGSIHRSQKFALHFHQ